MDIGQPKKVNLDQMAFILKVQYVSKIFWESSNVFQITSFNLYLSRRYIFIFYQISRHALKMFKTDIPNTFRTIYNESQKLCEYFFLQ